MAAPKLYDPGAPIYSPDAAASAEETAASQGLPGVGLVSHDATIASNAGAPPAPASASAPTGNRVRIVGPDGEFASVDESEVPKALKLGYTLETPEQAAVRDFLDRHKGISADVDVALRSFAEQASFGASESLINDYILKDDPLMRAKEEALMKAHKTASLVGGGLGFGASLLYGGELFDTAAGAGKATEAAIMGSKATEKGIGVAVGEQLARLAPEGAEAAAKAAGPGFARTLIAKGAGHAVEGAVLSAPKALTEASLGDPEKAAETLLYGAGAGALIGFVGPAAKSIKKGFDTAAEVVGNKLSADGEGVAGALKSFSDKEAIKALNPLKKFSKKIDGIGESDVADVIRRHQLMPKFGETAEQVAEKVASATESTGQKIGSFVEGVSGQAPAVDSGEVANVLADVEEQWSTGAKSVGASGIRSKLKALSNDIVAAFPEKMSLADIVDVRRIVDDAIPEGEKSKALRSAIMDLRTGLENKFFSKAEEAISASGGDAKAALAEFSKLKSDYRALVTLRDATKDNVARGIANRSHSLTDYLGNMIGGHVGGFVGGPIGSVAGALLGGAVNKAGRLYGNTYLSKGADALAAMFENPAARDPLDAGGLLGIEQAMKATKEKLDDVGSVLSGAVRPSAMETLPDHAAVSFVQSFQKGNSTSEEKMEHYRSLADEITSLTSDPTKMHARLEQLTAPFKDAPTIAPLYAQKAVQTIQYLQSTMPKDTQPPNPFAKRDWKPSDAALADWARRWEVAMDPFSVVRRVGDASLTRADVETLGTLYPKIYEEIRKSVLEYGMSGDAAALPYSKRLKLGTLMGAPVDPSLRDVAGLQSLYGAAPQQSTGAPPKRGPKAPHAKLDADALGAPTGVQKISSK